jgi:ketosteroid isomerase-like protein
LHAESLVAVEEIKSLKARYFRLMDTKQRHDFADVFTEGAIMLNGPVEQAPIQGRNEIVEYVRSSTQHLITVHHGHTPEIDVTGANDAGGVWPMHDQLRGPDGFALDGWGHYHERYQRDQAGHWRIAYTELTRLRVTSSSAVVTKALWPEAPDWALAED